MAPYTLHTDANYVGASLANSYSHILYEARLCGRARRVLACALPPEPLCIELCVFSACTADYLLRLYCGRTVSRNVVYVGTLPYWLEACLCVRLFTTSLIVDT